MSPTTLLHNTAGDKASLTLFKDSIYIMYYFSNANYKLFQSIITEKYRRYVISECPFLRSCQLPVGEGNYCKMKLRSGHSW